MIYPKSITILIAELIKLPGIGPKFAQRLVNHIIRLNYEDTSNLAKALIRVKKDVRLCAKCFCYTDVEVCHICSDATRNKNIICIVEAPDDVFIIEKADSFKGVYYVLGGVIDLISGIGPDKLRVKQLVERVKQDNPEEVLIAVNFDLKGETTANYLVQQLSPFNIKITRPAQGLPAGVEIGHIDSNTLHQALKRRQEIRR